METEKFQDMVLEQLVRLTQDTTEIKSKIGVMETKIDMVESKVNTMETKIDSLESKMGAVETKLNTIDAKIDRIDKKLDHTMEGVACLREDVNGLKDEKFEIRRVK